MRKLALPIGLPFRYTENMDDGQHFGKPKRGRPSGRAFSAPISLRLPNETLEAIDAFIAAQPDPKPTRPEAIRQIVTEWLEAKS